MLNVQLIEGVIQAMRKNENRLLGLYHHYAQWKEEHRALYARLLELRRLTRWNPSNYDHSDWESHHLMAREAFIPFMMDWQRHLDHEQQKVYPLVMSISTDGGMNPIRVLVQDGRIAEQFFESYMKAVREGASAEEALAHLAQVLSIVAEHFRIEEETIVPAAEQLMNDLEYSGS